PSVVREGNEPTSVDKNFHGRCRRVVTKDAFDQPAQFFRSRRIMSRDRMDQPDQDRPKALITACHPRTRQGTPLAFRAPIFSRPERPDASITRVVPGSGYDHSDVIFIDLVNPSRTGNRPAEFHL